MQRLLYALCILTFILSFPQFIDAQRLHFPGEDDTEIAKEGTSLCKPGVANRSKSKGLEVAYGIIGAHQLQGLNAESGARPLAQVDQIAQFRAKVKIPIIHKPGLTLLLGYAYGSETYQLTAQASNIAYLFNGLNGKTLKSQKADIILSKSFNEKFYGVFRFRASFNGDYNGFVDLDSRYAAYSGAAIFMAKPHDKLEWGAGLSYSNNFFNNRVLPFLVYNQTFNDKWGIETVLPVKITARYNINHNNLFLFGTEYNSKNYSIDVTNDSALNEFQIRHSEIKTGVSLQKKLFCWIWLQASTGLSIPIRNEFRNTIIPEDSFRAQAGTAPYFKIGLFLSPDMSHK